MASALSTDLRASLTWLLQDALELSTITDVSKLEYTAGLANGVGSGQADRIWHDERTLAAGAADDLVLSALASSVFGNSVQVALAKVKALLIVCKTTDAGAELTVGNAASHTWLGPFNTATARATLAADSSLLLINKQAGWSVGVGTTDVLRILNSGSGSATYRIVIVGTSS
ncbi:MAG: hypothetical protein K8U03_06645 [Planctomycetia bacterium]|nr:hypothetical protein [Planctomycetia bacterium]